MMNRHLRYFYFNFMFGSFRKLYADFNGNLMARNPINNESKCNVFPLSL